MSLPTFFKDRPRLAKADVVLTSPPGYLEYIAFDLAVVELGWHGRGDWCWMNLDLGRPKKACLLQAEKPSSHRAEEHDGFLTMSIPQ